MRRPFSAYDSSGSFIFVCYSHDDAALVYPEIERLHQSGFNIWYDEGISPGSEWSESLAYHIQQCAVFLYFVTPRSVEREHCRREVNFALSNGKQILAVHLAETQVPPALQLNLSHRQAVLKYELPSKAYEEKLDRALTDALGTLLESRPKVSGLSRRSRAVRWKIAATVATLLLVSLGSSLWRYGLQSDEAMSPAAEPSGLGRAITKISVSTFDDSSPDSAMEWLASGLSAQLRNQLGQIEGLNVVPPGVPGAAVLRGTVQASGNEVVAFVELADPGSGATLWTHEFQGVADDPMEMQKQVLLQILRVLERQLIADPARPRGQAAQIAWTRSIAEGGTGGDPVTQRVWLERVIAEDPQFAPAYLGLFWRYLQHARAYAQPVWVTKAAKALDRAEALGLGQQPDWYMSKGAYLWQFEGAFDEAETYLRRSLLAGGSGIQYAQWMMGSGLVREARDYLEQAVSSQPYEPVIWNSLANARALDGDNEGAHEAALEASKRVPPDNVYIRYALAWALPRLGHPDQAEREFEHLRTESKRLQRFPELHIGVLALESDIALALGEHERAAKIAASIEAEGWHQLAGVLFLAMGDDEQATRALEAGSKPPFYRLNHLPDWLKYLTPAQREDPRIRRMLDAMGLTEQWRLEFCRRISTLPPESGLACDPRHYAS